MPGSPAPQPVTAEAQDSTSERKPSRQFFTPRQNGPRLSPEQAARQGRVVSCALASFPSPGAAMTFLNTDQPGLGRPIDLAVESAAGLAAVEAMLASQTPVDG